MQVRQVAAGQPTLSGGDAQWRLTIGYCDRCAEHFLLLTLCWLIRTNVAGLSGGVLRVLNPL